MEKFAFLAALFLSLSLFPVYATPQDDAFQKIADACSSNIHSLIDQAIDLGDHHSRRVTVRISKVISWI